MFKATLIVGLAALALTFSAPASPDANSTAGDNDANPLAATLEAHGGIDTWRKQRRMDYTLDGFPLSPQVAKPSRSTVDLKTRHNRIQSDGYTLGWDGKQAWTTPGPDAVGLPPRFYALGSFYFIGMPFVFADDGIILQERGEATFKGKTYRVVSVGYKRGVGHTSEDDYHAFIDPDTNRLALINHSVTEIGVERVTWTFDEWQTVDGLLVPVRMTYYAGWNPEDPGEGASFTIENVKFASTPPTRDVYAAPTGAVLAEAIPD